MVYLSEGEAIEWQVIEVRPLKKTSLPAVPTLCSLCLCVRIKKTREALKGTGKGFFSHRGTELHRGADGHVRLLASASR